MRSLYSAGTTTRRILENLHGEACNSGRGDERHRFGIMCQEVIYWSLFRVVNEPAHLFCLLSRFLNGQGIPRNPPVYGWSKRLAILCSTMQKLYNCYSKPLWQQPGTRRQSEFITVFIRSASAWILTLQILYQIGSLPISLLNSVNLYTNFTAIDK